MNKQFEEKQKVKILELNIVRSLSTDEIPFRYVNWLKTPLRKHYQDDLIQKTKLHSTKVTYVAKNAIEKHLKKKASN